MSDTAEVVEIGSRGIDRNMVKGASLTRAMKDGSAMQSGCSPETPVRKTSILFFAVFLNPSWITISTSRARSSSSASGDFLQRPRERQPVRPDDHDCIGASLAEPPGILCPAGRCRTRHEACLTTATRKPRAFRSGMTFSMSVVLPLFDAAATNETIRPFSFRNPHSLFRNCYVSVRSLDSGFRFLPKIRTPRMPSS